VRSREVRKCEAWRLIKRMVITVAILLVLLAEGEEMISTLGSIIIGGLITWGVAYLYYSKAGEELRNEARELRKLNVLIIHAMEEGVSQNLTEIKMESLAVLL